MRKILVVTPFNSQWVDELYHSFNEIGQATFLSFDFPPLTQQLVQNKEFINYAKTAYDKLLLVLAKSDAQEIYISYEFAWQYFNTDFFEKLGDSIRIVGMLWDDSTFHEMNYQLAKHMGINTFTTGCPISALKLREKGCEAEFMQVYGSEKTYKPKNLLHKTHEAAFFGDPAKADRKTMLLPFQEIDGFEIFGGHEIPLPLNQMIERIRNTKIIVNFSKSFADERNRTVFQYKARILESIFCGSLPVTEYCPATELLFDGVVPQFKEPEEGADRIEFFIKNENLIIKKIATLEKLAKKYRPVVTLKKIFSSDCV